MFNWAISLSLLLIVSSNLAWLVLRAFISILEQLEQPLPVEALESNVALGFALVLSQRVLCLLQELYVSPSSIKSLIEAHPSGEARDSFANV
jgi:hypothetical protein